jgi:hypothetical protein
MNRAIMLTACAIAAGVAAAPVALVSSAAFAQSPSQYRPTADRDHDGIPNRYDRHDDRGALGDRDHDGVPNAFDNRNDNGPRGDKDHDGVPNKYDRNDHNPYRQ